MKMIFYDRFSLWVVVILFFILTGCTLHATRDISDRLNPDELYNSYKIHPTDLSLQSKCANPPTVNIVNVESRIEDYDILENNPSRVVINPKEMMDNVALYLDAGFRKSNIRVDSQSSKVIQIKMLDSKWDRGAWSLGGYFKMGLVIPETGFNKYYEATDNAALGYTASAYAIHVVTRQVIDDPVIQNYILCQ